MIRGIGIDAVELPRMKKIIEEKPKMITRILTVREKELFDGLPLKRQMAPYSKAAAIGRTIWLHTSMPFSPKITRATAEQTMQRTTSQVNPFFGLT